MGLFGTMYIGYSGVFTTSMGMNVAADNISNLNTTGFKGSRYEFANSLVEAYAETFRKEKGLGSNVKTIRTLFTQGAIVTTDSPTDLAISGKGFFVVSDKKGNLFYTRDGQFFINQVDEQYLALQNSMGLYLLGSAPEATSADLNDLKPYLIPKVMPPKGTSNIDLQLIFDSTKPMETIDDPLWQNYDATSSTIIEDQKFDYVFDFYGYDTLGNKTNFKLYVDRTDNNNEYELLFALEDPTLDGRGTGKYQGAFLYGRLSFGGNGDVVGTQFWEISNPSSFDPTTDPPMDLTTLGRPQFQVNVGGATQTITLNLGFKVEPDGSITRSTNPTKLQANPFAQLYFNQDGYPIGVFDKIEVITEEGKVVAWYTNNKNIEVSKIFLADFSGYEESLIKVGNGLFMAREGAQPFIFSPGVFERGRLLSGALENSNVDIASEMVSLITLQRAFQINTRVITTADQMLEDFLSKR
ncbi:flagellar hook-basal body complex protein [Thermodesulfobacterium sp. TA1]|uniref:flagellar hook protein FlgE n=1 Tax=Thermodesulfobacterium sp. TA1 TaxID=2234087 RepID=UPI001231BF59|nr:flagellar hook-basal body complex protein [Thermodesulfobacterium sp. TA1]QER41353.1 flagellar hook-basal body complex protein [Thermodesulfobacterium sp. TA1]